MKTLTTFIFLICAVLSCSGQCPSDKRQYDVSASYGIISPDQLTGNFLPGDNTGGSGTKTITGNASSKFISIKYFAFSRLAFGFSGGMSTEKGQYGDSYNPSVVLSSFNQNVTTVAIEVYYVYFFRKYLEVYTLVGGGPAFTASTTVTNPTASTPESTATSKFDGLTMQYTPIAFRVGGKFGAFCELGIGYKGVVNAGISYKFGVPCWWKL